MSKALLSVARVTYSLTNGTADFIATVAYLLRKVGSDLYEEALHKRVEAARRRTRAAAQSIESIQKQKADAIKLYDRELTHQAGLSVKATRDLVRIKEAAQLEAYNNLRVYRGF